MKATNEQKQLMKMYHLKFDDMTSYHEAKNKIDRIRKEKEKNGKSWMKGNNLEGSGWFDRWFEDDK